MQPQLREMGKDSRINPGDVISIAIFPAEEYSRDVTVQPDGKIEVPLIGSVLVKGLVSRELQELLQEKYARYVANPQVTVSVRRFAGRRVAIIGEVRSPGFYEYRDGMRLLELVSLAGGLTDNARPARVRVLRSGSDCLFVNFQKVLDGAADRDPPMAPGDTVYVPKRRLAAGAAWLTNNIIPWASFFTILTGVAVISRQ